MVAETIFKRVGRGEGRKKGKSGAAPFMHTAPITHSVDTRRPSLPQGASPPAQPTTNMQHLAGALVGDQAKELGETIGSRSWVLGVRAEITRQTGVVQEEFSTPR